MIYYTYNQNQHLLAHFIEHLLATALKKKGILVNKANSGAGYSLIEADFEDHYVFLKELTAEDFEKHKNLVLSEECSRFLHQRHVFSKLLSDGYGSVEAFWEQVADLKKRKFSSLEKIIACFQLKNIKSKIQLKSVHQWQFTNEINLGETYQSNLGPGIHEILALIYCQNYFEALLIANYFHCLTPKLKSQFYESGFAYHLDSLLSKATYQALIISFSFVGGKIEKPWLIINDEIIDQAVDSLNKEISNKKFNLGSLLQQKIEWGSTWENLELLELFHPIQTRLLLKSLLSRAFLFN